MKTKNSKATKATATVEIAIKTAVDRALKKDNVSNSHALRTDAQIKGIALLTARTYCASSINGALLTAVASLDRKAFKHDAKKHVIACIGNKGACFGTCEGVGTVGADSFALFSDGSIIALGTFGQLTVQDCGTMEKFIGDVRKGEYFATGQRIVILDGEKANTELDGVIVGTKDNATSIYYGVITRHGSNYGVTTKERKENAYNKGIGARTATVSVLTDAQTAAIVAKSKK